jgi:hypothetical protein
MSKEKDADEVEEEEETADGKKKTRRVKIVKKVVRKKKTGEADGGGKNAPPTCARPAALLALKNPTKKHTPQTLLRRDARVDSFGAEQRKRAATNVVGASAHRLGLQVRQCVRPSANAQL